MLKTDRITIRELAAKAGVSVCTVNNAMTGRGRMSEATRRKVRDAAAKLGYRPNRMAQALARNPIRIIVVHPDVWPGFYGPLVTGVAQATRDLADRKVSGTVHKVPVKADGKALLTTIRRFTAPKGNEKIGVILCPGHERWSAMTAHLEAASIPLVLLGLDLPGAARVALVRHDAVRSGRIAAGLLAPMVAGRPVAIMVGSMATGDHRDKVSGFREEAGRLGLSVAGVYEAQDEPARAFPVTERIFDEHPDAGGVYVASDNSAGACRYFREHHLSGAVNLAVTGVFPQVRRNLADGTVQFALYQRMGEQGRLAVQTLYEFMAEGVRPQAELLIPPLIATRNNMDVIGATP
ncbi:MAG: LacI family DNA-binding transcriptional regulator [Planctomycetota bacterium]